MKGEKIVGPEDITVEDWKCVAAGFTIGRNCSIRSRVRKCLRNGGEECRADF